ncbi:hypothetical protein DBV15_09460 [Temnothorax longispinosus]|uniref:Uncharacterized protein n=1 Tax=Temnothorax longispinosus TaxID=300112 RepID=A0A4S2KML8_9HYME|nr:hypothetical protein DBV15_09460 [Temnothorax longispinosus]
MYSGNDGASSVARNGGDSDGDDDGGDDDDDDDDDDGDDGDARPRRSRVCLPTAAAESGRTRAAATA